MAITGSLCVLIYSTGHLNVPGSMLSELSHEILTTTLWGRNHHPHFTDEATKAFRGKVLWPQWSGADSGAESGGSSPPLLGRLCFPHNSWHILPLCSALHHLEAVPGPLRWLTITADITQWGLNKLHMNVLWVLRRKDSCSRNMNVVTTFELFYSPFSLHTTNTWCVPSTDGRTKTRPDPYLHRARGLAGREKLTHPS